MAHETIRNSDGISCPGCSLTRACIHLPRDEFAAARELHPMIVLWILLLLYLFIFRYLLGRQIPLTFPLALLSSYLNDNAESFASIHSVFKFACLPDSGKFS